MNKLSSDVISALRTDVTITSAPQCVTELVLNSIDAEATCIAVRVDLSLFKLQVIDNGCGISESDLNLLGNRYLTSKCHSLDDLRAHLSSFGFRGEALASLCEVAGTLMITSRHASSGNTFCKIVTQGRHQKVVRASRPRQAQGTTVLVGDFLYNRPVRRSRIKPAFDLEEIKSHLEKIALIHPQVSLSLRDDASGQIILETKKSSNVVDTFSSLFGPAIADTLCAVNESSKPFEVSGFISKEAYTNKNLQFIYVNKRLLVKSKLHKLVNSIMARSSLLKMNNVPHNPISKELNSAFFLAMSPPKRAKHAIYILNITCPYIEYDITLDPKKTLIEFRNWDTILNCIEKLLRNFLEPQVTPDTPIKTAASSVLDEIDRLAREDASAIGDELTANLGIRTMLGRPARRDTIIFTPPSQYTQEPTIIPSQSEKESSALLTSCSEDPFPSHLRSRAAPSVSSENPFTTTQSADQNHDFDTTSREASSAASTETFLNMFKQPVFHKKLKHPKPQVKLPVGGSLHFDLNLQRLASMVRPVGLANYSEIDTNEQRTFRIFDRVQKFSVTKGAQLSPASNDSAMYHTPVNAQEPNQSKNGRSAESLADLPYVSDLVAPSGNSESTATPPSIPVQASPTVPENSGTVFQNSSETISEEDPFIQVMYENSESPENSAAHDLETISEEDSNNRVISNLQVSPGTHDLDTMSKGDTLHGSTSNLQESPGNSTSHDLLITGNSLPQDQPHQQIPEESDSMNQHDNVGENVSEPEEELNRTSPVANVPVFMCSEDFLVTRDDTFAIPKEHTSGIQTSPSTASMLENYQKIIADSDNFNQSSRIVTESESKSVCCAQPGPHRNNVNTVSSDSSVRCFIDHQGSSEEFCHLNRQSTSESEQSALLSNRGDVERSERSPILDTHQISESRVSNDHPMSILSSPFEQGSEESYNARPTSNYAASSNLQEKNNVSNNYLINPRKRCAEPNGSENTPLNKIVPSNYLINSRNGDIYSNTPRENEMSSVEKSPEKNQSSHQLQNSGSSSGRLSRHSVVLDCSIDGLVESLNRKHSCIFKDIEENRDSFKPNEAMMDIETTVNLEQNVTRLSPNEEIENESTRDVLEDTVMEIETNDDSTVQLENSSERFRISSSCDEALLAVYDKTILEMGYPRGATSSLARSDSVATGDKTDLVEGDEPETLVNETDKVSSENDDWEEHTDNKGRKSFVHRTSGAIRCHLDQEKNFEIVDRCQFLPKGLSPLVGSTMTSLALHRLRSKTKDLEISSNVGQIGNLEELAAAKWPNGKPEGVLSWSVIDRLLSTCETENEAPVASAMVQDQPNAQIKVYSICYPYTFTKDIFNNLRVLGQLDRKFIVTIAKLVSETEQTEVVVLFDQHAVHERIRVEQLTKEYREPGPGFVWRSAPVHPALPLSVSAREVRVMTNCSEKLRCLGLQFTKKDSHSVSITAVPTCLLLREDREVHGRGASVLKSYLESLIREEVDSLVETRGAGVEQPAIIRNVIASEACRGAVKFGHVLETKDCEAYLQNLSNCDVPFQCAHGRPALTPIADLSHLQKHIKPRKLNLWKLRRTS